MKKIYVMLMIITAVLLIITPVVYAQQKPTEDVGEIIDKTVDGLDMKQINTMIDELNEKSGDYMPEISFKGFLDSMLEGRQYIGFKDIFTGFIKYIFKEISGSLYFLGEILVLGVVSAILDNIHGAFNGESIKSIASMAVYILMTVIIMQNLNIAMGIGKQAINQMTNFMQAMLPVIEARSSDIVMPDR